MTKHDDEATTKKQSTLDENDITTTRMGRRASVAMIGAVGASLAALGLGAATARAQDRGCSDADPTDPYGRGRSCGGAGGAHPCSDVDPTDPGGQGRTCHTGGPCSDVDPSDPVGHGRYCPGGGSGSGSYGGGVTDSDPSDPVGQGRGSRGGGSSGRGCSDSDPSDPAGMGRRC
jgi:translation initiation factor IF-2